MPHMNIVPVKTQDSFKVQAGEAIQDSFVKINLSFYTSNRQQQVRNFMFGSAPMWNAKKHKYLDLIRAPIATVNI